MSTEGWPSQALAAAKPAVFWSEHPEAPAPAPRLDGEVKADLTVIGGGFTGLWAALQALEDQPDLRVVLLESERCGFGASSRNGGFCDGSVTHGVRNGVFHWPDEIGALVRMGRENLEGIETTVERYRISADFRQTAEVDVATEPWHLDVLQEGLEVHESIGGNVQLVDSDAMQARIHSPTYLGGLIRFSDMALVDPARLCWGLRAAAESLGAAVYEHSRAVAVEDDGAGLRVATPSGIVRTERVLMATNAYDGPIRRPRRYIIPVYDHVLMTEPLTSSQVASIGWQEREGVGEASNQFHYYRMTEDHRILWGGYDATYHFGNGVDPQHDQSEVTHGKLAEHFFETFPQLEGLRFSHRWGGPIATTTHFAPTWGSAKQGRLTWVGGYTGLGVGSSRFGARVALDLVFGLTTERTSLEMVRRKPVPFPPEPFRWTGVQLTRRAIQRSDGNEGKRGAWLKLLDSFGVGFDS